ncbi:hypothetical protein HU200_055978 [Digitaria exilis]|uniref:Uncharacterized protein n=1 Tax=Digitaria exilis TaxID=1010633 RepID=A0A835ACW0_9POAL|nr:hypothetical protein HU200_055978 [Digitaria exilis]
MASAPTSPSLSGQLLLLQVSSPCMGRLGGTRQRSPLSVAVATQARPGQPSAQGNGGGGGKVCATPRTTTLMAKRGPTPPGQPPPEGTGGGGGKVHSTPTMGLMAVGGPMPPPEGTDGKFHAIHDAAHAVQPSYIGAAEKKT